MINEPLYNKTVSILVDAYFNDTLAHDVCTACAVGNIVAAGMGDKIITVDGELRWEKNVCTRGKGWSEVFYTAGHRQYVSNLRYTDYAKKQIDRTGYTWQELAKIEYAFETAPKGDCNEDWMFNGLMAVIEVLDVIHENKDTAVTETTKKRFNKAAV